jgi:hypothetical protein
MSGVTTLIGDLKMGTEKEMGTKLKKGRCPFLDTFHFPSILHGLQINLLIFPVFFFFFFITRFFSQWDQNVQFLWGKKKKKVAINSAQKLFPTYLNPRPCD